MAKKQSEKKKKESIYLRVLDKAWSYLSKDANHLPPKMNSKQNIGICLMYFEQTHGSEAVAAMSRFIAWAEENGKQDIIPVTLGHDLSGCQDKLMLPRTSSY